MSAPLPSAFRTGFQRYIEEGSTGRAAALRLNPPPATGARWARQVRTVDHAEPARNGPPRGSGKLAPHQAFLEELIAQDPDITPFELRDALADAEGVRVPHFSIAKLPSRPGFTTKRVAGRRRTPLRQGKAAACRLVQTPAACHCGLARARCLH